MSDMRHQMSFFRSADLKSVKRDAEPKPVELSLEDFIKSYEAARRAAKDNPKPLTPLQKRMQSGSV